MPRRNKSISSRSVQKKIKSVLRTDQLTTHPGWKTIKSRRDDPPVYLYEPIIQRKIRAFVTIPATGLDMKFSSVANAHAMSNAFQFIGINRVDIYGVADGTTIVVEFFWREQRPFTFTDTGVTGSRRSHISAKLANKEVDWYGVASTNNILNVKVYNTSATLVASSAVVDFYCQYYGNKPSPVETPLGVHLGDLSHQSANSLASSLENLSLDNSADM